MGFGIPKVDYYRTVQHEKLSHEIWGLLGPNVSLGSFFKTVIVYSFRLEPIHVKTSLWGIP